MNEEYEYKKEDVEKVLNLLSTSFPEKATPEYAVKVLVYMREKTLAIEDLGGEDFKSLIKDLAEN